MPFHADLQMCFIPDGFSSVLQVKIMNNGKAKFRVMEDDQSGWAESCFYLKSAMEDNAKINSLQPESNINFTFCTDKAGSRQASTEKIHTYFQVNFLCCDQGGVTFYVLVKTTCTLILLFLNHCPCWCMLFFYFIWPYLFFCFIFILSFCHFFIKYLLTLPHLPP